jgi:hypothetical protein
MKTPIVFIIFNRPEKTEAIFESIRLARPEQLFIIADGPRNEAELSKCLSARAITENIDWPCEVRRQYLKKNRGVRYAPPEGISWVFEHVDRAIFLEDDCLPNPSFFPFCEELLERYKDDERIMHISGNNFEPLGKYSSEDSYWFSHIPYLWGWATWKRAWKFYDPSMHDWPQIRNSEILKKAFPDKAVLNRWQYVLDNYFTGKAYSWDGPWVIACLEREGLCINPGTNLVTNIGFGSEATHSSSTDDWRSEWPTYSLNFPLIHPHRIEADEKRDAYSYREVFSVNKTIGQRTRWFLKSRWPKLYAFAKRLK